MHLPALELNDHDDGSNSTNHNNEWPQKVDDANPNVRSLWVKVNGSNKSITDHEWSSGLPKTPLTLERANMLMTATATTPSPIPP